jgi:hypothetical protein
MDIDGVCCIPHYEDHTLCQLVRRGRLFFLILASLIVLDRGASILFAIVAGAEDFSLWRSVLVPGFIIFGVVSLWWGDVWTRRVLAGWLLLKGGTHLFVFGSVLLGLQAVTPPEQTRFFVQMSAILVGIPILYGGFYIFAGLSLLLSRSLRAFFEHQALR